MMLCPNGHQNPEHYQYCGECGASLVLPKFGPADGRMTGVIEPPADAPTTQLNPTPPRLQQWHWKDRGPPPPGATWSRDFPPDTPRKRVPLWLWITAISVAVVAVVAVVATVTVWGINRIVNRATDNERWSAFPHTMGCAVDTSPPDMPPEPSPPPPEIVNTYPPDMARVKQVDLAHAGGQLLALSVEFGQPPMPESMWYVIELMGSGGHKGSVTIFSTPPDPGPVEWVAGRMDLFFGDAVRDRNHEIGPRHNNPNLLTSVQADGNVAEFVVDLAGQSELLGNGPFKPTIRVGANPWDRPPTGGPVVFFYQQYCRWDTAQPGPGAASPPTAPANPSLAPPPPPTGYIPAPGTVPPTAATQPSLPDADAQGFLGYPGARCNYTNPAVAIGRTSQSLVVICRTGVGRLYYKGFGLQNGLSVEIDDPVQTGTAFIATNNGVQYLVSPDALIITQGSTTVSKEPMLEYWPR